MKKLTLVAFVACLSILAVSCKNQPKEEATEPAAVEEVAAPAEEVTPADAVEAVEGAAAAVETAAQTVETVATEVVAK